jgi:hypothetical protein
VPCWHESFGSPAGSESPVALRPVLADGLPLSGGRTLVACFIGSFQRNFNSLRYWLDSGA